MARLKTFAFRINSEEENLLTTVAEKMRRSKGDAIRVLILQAAQDMGVIYKTKQATVEMPLTESKISLDQKGDQE